MAKSAQDHKAFLDAQNKSVRMLVTLRDELYDGEWAKMEEDLKDRLLGKPYIFKLVNRIEADIEGLNLLRDYETENKINLVKFM